MPQDNDSVYNEICNAGISVNIQPIPLEPVNTKMKTISKRETKAYIIECKI